jgi:hypothetical protein
MRISLDISERVVARAEADGVSVEAFVKSVSEQAAEPRPDTERERVDLQTTRDAASNIRELSKRLTLGGIKIRDLVHEGHRY